MSLEVGDGHLLPVRDDWATGRSSSCTVIRTGPAMATGPGSDIFRLDEHGRIVEHWEGHAALGVVSQISALELGLRARSCAIPRSRRSLVAKCWRSCLCHPARTILG
jgi:hypothetical protein